MSGWRLSREAPDRQLHRYECLTCHQASPPSDSPEAPETWAVEHTLHRGVGRTRHRRFARSVTDLWRAQSSPTVTVAGERVFRLMEVAAEELRIGDLLAVGGVFHRVVDLRGVPGRRGRLVFLHGQRGPELLGPTARYEIRRPQPVHRLPGGPAEKR